MDRKLDDIGFLEGEIESSGGAKIDYPLLVLRQIDRVDKVISSGSDTTIIRSITALTKLIQPYSDKKFKEEITNIEKRYAKERNNLKPNDNNGENNLELEKVFEVYGKLMELLRRIGFIPEKGIGDRK